MLNCANEVCRSSDHIYNNLLSTAGQVSSQAWLPCLVYRFTPLAGGAFFVSLFFHKIIIFENRTFINSNYFLESFQSFHDNQTHIFKSTDIKHKNYESKSHWRWQNPCRTLSELLSSNWKRIEFGACLKLSSFGNQ